MKRVVLPILVALLACPANAQHSHSAVDEPAQTGQSAFAAISQIVQTLSDDPKTDWSKVNIPALRDHLTDMDMVTMQAMVATHTDARTVAFTITGQGEVAGAVRRMTLAHAPMLMSATQWDVRAEPSAGGATMRIKVGTDQELARVLGLGFFGVLTLGAHHQAHHLQIALGKNPHH